jgi:hypothetical protein
MVSNQLGLLLDDADDLPDFASAAARLRQLLPGIDTDRFAEAFPAVLDVADFERALDVGGPPGKGGQGLAGQLLLRNAAAGDGLCVSAQLTLACGTLLPPPLPAPQDAKRLMPGMDVPAMLRSNPGGPGETAAG